MPGFWVWKERKALVRKLTRLSEHHFATPVSEQLGPLASDFGKIEKLIVANQAGFLDAWDEFFNT